VAFSQRSYGAIVNLYRRAMSRTRGLPADEDVGVVGVKSLTTSEETRIRGLSHIYDVPFETLQRVHELLEHAVVVAAMGICEANEGGELPVSGGFPYSPGRTTDVVLVSTMFKVGSMALSRLLWRVAYEQRLTHVSLVKTHHPAWPALLERHVHKTVRLSLVNVFGRKPLDVYASAYFQDILTPGKYSFFSALSSSLPGSDTATLRGAVLSTPVHVLVDHFCAQDWKSVVWLNPNPYIWSNCVALRRADRGSFDDEGVDDDRCVLDNITKEMFDGEVTNVPFHVRAKRGHFNTIHEGADADGDSSLSFVDAYLLNFRTLVRDASLLLKALSVSGTHTLSSSDNRGRSKWYGPKYAQFLEALESGGGCGGACEGPHRAGSCAAGEWTGNRQ